MAPRLATLSLSGIATFTGLVGLEHVLRPDYDPVSRYVSEYAVGRYHRVMTTAFFALAFGSATLLVDLTRTVPTSARSTAGLTCLGIWSGAILLAGIFATDLAGPDGLPKHPTTQAPSTVWHRSWVWPACRWPASCWVVGSGAIRPGVPWRVPR